MTSIPTALRRQFFMKAAMGDREALADVENMVDSGSLALRRSRDALLGRLDTSLQRWLNDALECAISSGQDRRVVEVFVRAGGRAVTEDQRMALGASLEALRIYAKHGGDLSGMPAYSSKVDCLSFLDKQGVSFLVADGNRHTPLFGAVLRGGGSAVRWHLAHGADANERNQFGQTPLFLAGHSKEPDEVIAALLEYGADPRACDSQNATPIILLLSAGTGPLLRLVAAGADLTVPVVTRATGRRRSLTTVPVRQYLERQLKIPTPALLEAIAKSDSVTHAAFRLSS
jgi:hypothetical protein